VGSVWNFKKITILKSRLPFETAFIQFFLGQPYSQDEENNACLNKGEFQKSQIIVRILFHNILVVSPAYRKF